MQIPAAPQLRQPAAQTTLEQHPQAQVLDSLPGLGVVLASRLLAEFGSEADAGSSARTAAAA